MPSRRSFFGLFLGIILGVLFEGHFLKNDVAIFQTSDSVG